MGQAPAPRPDFRRFGLGHRWPGAAVLAGLKWTVDASTPRVSLDESSGPTSGTTCTWPQMNTDNTDKKEARTGIPLRWFLSVFIRVHLWPNLCCPRYSPKGGTMVERQRAPLYFPGFFDVGFVVIGFGALAIIWRMISASSFR